MYDHGPNENLLVYGSPRPPKYRLDRITHKNIYVIYAKNDWFVPIHGIHALKRDIPHLREIYQISNPQANHIDPLVGMTVALEVNAKIINILRRYR